MYIILKSTGKHVLYSDDGEIISEHDSWYEATMEMEKLSVI